MSLTELLLVDHVDLHVVENARAHRTDRFEEVQQADAPAAVLRRGQSFLATIHFRPRGYSASKDVLRIVFTFGASPTPMKSTWGSVTVNGVAGSELDGNVWRVREVSREGKSLKVELTSPANAPVGLWQIRVETKLKKDLYSAPQKFNYQDTVYLLFNPWCKDDDVYMDDAHLLDEYILSDVGKIWVGPWGSSRGRQWVFGQFDDHVLPAAMLMMERCGLPPANRGDPVRMTRAISKIVNANDDRGVLQGRWDGDYKGGVAPAQWTGSGPILEQFVTTGNEVKYGQCWVFAGVVTTVCRALGIPSRVVSNFVSAHDANASLTVDRYFDAQNEELKFDPNNENGEDSVWNYHVWNDVWMARPDLPSGYGGWQAIDATPQETSDGVFQCGPASLEAIRRGAVGLNYDVSFLLASVNADLVNWKEDPTCELGYSRMQCNKYHIGRMVYTKQPFIFDPNGEKDREDITLQYKAREGTQAERLNLYNGVQGNLRAKRFYDVADVSVSDIEFDLVELETVNMGDNFSVTVHIHNKCKQERKVQASLSAASIFYTGVRAKVVKSATGNFKLKPNSKETLRLVVRPEEYLPKLVEYCNMKIYAIATVEDTRATWAEEDDFQIIKPNLDIKVKNCIPSTNAPCTVEMSFKNPFKKTLNDCKFNCSGPGLTKNTLIEFRPVGPLEEVTLEHTFTPSRAGIHNLVATFSSLELVDVTGSANLEVVENNA